MTRREAVKIIGCSVGTVKNYVKRGYIRTIKLPDGKLSYNEDDVYALAGKRKPRDYNNVVIYARVSGKGDPKLEKKLEEQVQDLNRWAMARGIAVDKVYKDTGFATNMKRKGFKELMLSVFRKEVCTLILFTRCRLVRFGWDTFEWIFKMHGVEVLIASPMIEIPEYLDEQSRDLADMLAEAKIDRVRPAVEPKEGSFSKRPRDQR